MYGWFYMPSSCFSYPGLLRKESCLRRITASLEPKMARTHTIFNGFLWNWIVNSQEKWWITIFLGHFATFLEITTMIFPGDWNFCPVDSVRWLDSRLKGAHCASRAQRGAPCCNHLSWWPRGHRWSRVSSKTLWRCGDPSLILPTKVTKQVDFFFSTKQMLIFQYVFTIIQGFSGTYSNGIYGLNRDIMAYRINKGDSPKLTLLWEKDDTKWYESVGSRARAVCITSISVPFSADSIPFRTRCLALHKCRVPLIWE